PEKVTINIKVEDPRKSKEEQVSAIFEVSPPGLLLGPFEQEGTIVFLANGPLTANDFSLKMKVERTLSESLSIQSIVRFLTQNPVYGAALAALVVLMIVFRKQVFGALSEIAGEEDIQPPKREV
ncbi:hypothetical protein HYS54_00750, partial [Candidatus Micrarchaeota archaeon]|nr:hypothetical protein [Candidatus Micrarchaeota archaeon]